MALGGFLRNGWIARKVRRELVFKSCFTATVVVMYIASKNKGLAEGVAVKSIFDLSTA
jgi:hypothetical protein